MGDTRGTGWRRPARALAAALGIAGGLAAVALLRPDPERLRGELEAQLEAASGRAFRIEGPISFALRPQPALEISGLQLSTPDRPGDLLRATHAHVFVAPLPLLWGDVALRGARLDAPILELDLEATRLEVDGSALELELLDGSLRASATLDGVRVERQRGPRSLALEDVALELALAGDVLELTLRSFRLCGGTGSAVLRVGPVGDSGAETDHQLDVELRDVSVAPLLDGLFEYTEATGRGDLTARLASRGSTATELLAAPSGTATALVRDGTLGGAAQLAFQAVAGGSRSVRFTRLAGSFRLRDGVIDSDDLDLIGRDARARGTLRLDLASGDARTRWRRVSTP